MNLRKLLLAGFGATTLYMGTALYYDNRNMDTFLEMHKDVTNYLYLQQYQQTIDYVLQSYDEHVANGLEGTQKDAAQKVVNDLGLTLVHLEQQKQLYGQLEPQLNEWGGLVRKRKSDEGLFYASLVGVSILLLLGTGKPEEKK